MADTIKGFSPEEVLEIYRFLCIYEEKLEKVDSRKKLEETYPELTELNRLMSGFTCNYCTVKSLGTIGLVPMDNHVSMTNCRSSKLLSFLHHLRNSIAHGLLEKEGNNVYIYG